MQRLVPHPYPFENLISQFMVSVLVLHFFNTIRYTFQLTNTVASDRERNFSFLHTNFYAIVCSGIISIEVQYKCNHSLTILSVLHQNNAIEPIISAIFWREVGTAAFFQLESNAQFYAMLNIVKYCK